MARRWKLCVVTTHPIQYAAPWFRELAVDADIDLHVIFFRRLTAAQQGVGFDQPFSWDVPLEDGYSCESLDARSGARAVPRALWRLRRALKVRSPDAVLVTGWNEPALAAALPLTRAMGIPTICRGDSNAFKPRSFFTRLAQRCLLRFPNAFTTVGCANADFYRRAGVPERKLFAGCHFVESSRMTALAQEMAGRRDAQRAAFGFLPGDFVFVFSGKHVGFKRPLMLVEAAARLRASGVAVKLLFAGSGALTDELQTRCRELSVPAYFLGFLNQTEMWNAYVPADALVLPSDASETWGLVVNEAMLFGLPVVVSDQVGCGPDLVISGETGYVFSGDVDALAEAMRVVASDPERARATGRRGQALVAAEYSTTKATQALKLALEKVAR